jgi:NitT/TauT family transport system substrate-binding protein
MTPPKGIAATLVALVCALAPGCGGGDERDTPDAPEKVKIGLVPIADVAPVFVGIERGYFERQGIELEPQFASGGAAIAPAVLSGDFDIGFSNTVSLLITASKGLPVQIVSQGALGGPDLRRPWADVLVAKGSGIRRPKDLEGKTIAANTLNNICEVTINATLEAKGVDVGEIKYTEVPFPDMLGALEQGRVDAACAVEPFVTEGKAAGMRGIDPFYAATAPDLTVAAYFASKQMIESDPELIARFRTAMAQSLRYSAEHPDAVRAVLPEYTQISEQDAQQINLPSWQPELTEDTIRTLSKLSEKYGLIERRPDLGELILP